MHIDSAIEDYLKKVQTRTSFQLLHRYFLKENYLQVVSRGCLTAPRYSYLVTENGGLIKCTNFEFICTRVLKEVERSINLKERETTEKSE